MIFISAVTDRVFSPIFFNYTCGISIRIGQHNYHFYYKVLRTSMNGVVGGLVGKCAVNFRFIERGTSFRVNLLWQQLNLRESPPLSQLEA